MKTLSLGKFRSLQQCSTPNGTFAVLALDHRNNLRNALNPQAPDSVTDADMAAFKVDVVRFIAPSATAVLLDPQVGVGPCIAERALPGSTGLMSAVEETGYTGDPTARKSAILPGWSVAKARKLGINAIKLLVYYHPDGPAAGEIEELVSQVGADCKAEDIPLFLEPLSYSLDPQKKKLSPEERRRVVLETARRLTPLGVEILKAEFPLDISAQPDEKDWEAACAELTAASLVPWVLLSASVPYETYLRQVRVACEQGASGVAAGRAVWQEAPMLKGTARTEFLSSVGSQRMARLTALCSALAKPWTEFYTTPTLEMDWYQQYGS